ncbi:hypothetical protein [Almyronema epifaneia]|uniref:ABC transporter permease n=1 Tax=Almyronema epifaneia S1 TaxID=2991925 RepID=A0ABW6IJK8_9CYAN
MFTALFDRLGNWNPQLLRELKGRLRPRNLMAAIAVSAIAQLILLSVFGTQLPPSFNPHEHLRLTTVPEIDFTFGTSTLPNYPPNLRVESVNNDVGQLYQSTRVISTAEQPKPGDRIWQIDGQTIDTFNDSFANVVDALRGYPGNQSLVNNPLLEQDVTLLVERPGVGQLTLSLPRVAVSDIYSQYCATSPEITPSPYDQGYYGNSRCQLNPEQTEFEIDWPAWYQDVFRGASLMLVIGLLTAGSFVLIQNLDREQRRGTLTFIRLSPRSSFNILSGQILGAPVAIYIAAALMLPLHVLSAVGAEISLVDLGAFYLVLGLSGFLFFSLSLLVGLIGKGLGGLQAWLVAGGFFLFQLVIGMAVSNGDFGSPFTLHWLILFSPASVLHYLLGFEAATSSSQTFEFAAYRLTLLSFVTLFCVNSLVWSLWLWHALKRKFVNPQVPLIERRYSYLMTACFEVFLLGFAASSNSFQEDVVLVAFLNLLFLGLLIAALQPSRQALEDWARFRLAERRSQRQALLKDLVQGENSPAILAIGLNIAIALGLMVIWTLQRNMASSTHELLGYIALGSLILIYASINQVWFLTQVNRPEIWSMGTLLVVMVAPLFARLLLEEVAALASVQFLEAVAVPWLMTPIGQSYGWAILSQWLLLIVVNLVTLRQLQKAGESGSKNLLARPKSALAEKSS